MTSTAMMSGDTDTAMPMVGDEAVKGESRRQQQVRDLAVQALAKEMHLDVEQVRNLYDAAHEQLAAHAKIKTYISVIATRLVRVAIQGEQKLQ